MADATGELLAIADELYALDLAEFTPARDVRAKELKGTDLAKPVKSLRKPSTAAWVVNLLVRHETEQVDQVLAVGAALRAAQASMSADELRTLTKQRRQLTAAVTSQARAVAKERGVRVTDAVADQVAATLTAAMVDEGCAKAVRSGLLVTTIEATGVDEVDAGAAVALPEALGFAAVPRASVTSTPPPSRPQLEVVPDPEADLKVRRAAEAELARAEAELADAQTGLDEAGEEVSRLEARGLQLSAEIDELRSRIAELEEEHDALDEELAEAEDTRDEARTSLDDLTRARDAARAALDRLSG
ncbi:hypothetical protein [Nocardioides marmotae]|uniref:hypothetical protein n=1 Tax=Nocardioides marmotae TaxID=2663857 RepID=UPI0012B50C77|nr:hypothetical protein [Nocardioides marmotae]MBC9732133.1 hypothetical protein [Nocardioides marmotae]MTB83254.1 hypothetical protein [Nocardioides marmotae]